MALTRLTTTMVLEGEEWVRIVVARHFKLPGVPHRPGRQNTTCVGSSGSWAVVEGAGARAGIAPTEMEAGVVGRGGSMVVLIACACGGWGGVGRSDSESLCLETKKIASGSEHRFLSSPQGGCGAHAYAVFTAVVVRGLRTPQGIEEGLAPSSAQLLLLHVGEIPKYPARLLALLLHTDHAYTHAHTASPSYELACILVPLLSWWGGRWCRASSVFALVLPPPPAS